MFNFLLSYKENVILVILSCSAVAHKRVAPSRATPFISLQQQQETLFLISMHFFLVFALSGLSSAGLCFRGSCRWNKAWRRACLFITTSKCKINSCSDEERWCCCCTKIAHFGMHGSTWTLVVFCIYVCSCLYLFWVLSEHQNLKIILNYLFSNTPITSQ